MTATPYVLTPATPENIAANFKPAFLDFLANADGFVQWTEIENGYDPSDTAAIATAMVAGGQWTEDDTGDLEMLASRLNDMLLWLDDLIPAIKEAEETVEYTAEMLPAPVG